LKSSLYFRVHGSVGPTLSFKKFAILVLLLQGEEPSMTMSQQFSSDSMKEDGKSMPLSKLSQSFPLFLFYSAVVVPIWIGVLLPLTITSVVVDKLVGFVKGGPKKNIKNVNAIASEYGSLDLSSIKAPAQREFDLILFGATGFTGK